MRKTALAGVFAIAIIAAGTTNSSASALGLLQVNEEKVAIAEPIDFSIADRAIEPKEMVEQPVQPSAQEYVVAEGDSLNKIADAHKTTWKRLFDKNETIEHPDMITVGTKLVIPKSDEVLKDRAIPQPVAPAPVASQPARTAPKARTTKPAATYQARGSVAGNTYTAGYCTWYVKNMRPDLPNNLGNAYTWVSRAAAQGIPTGSTPRVGAVGQRGNHVVYVQSVNGDGTVTISEMNHAGLYVRTVRTLPASYFTYIY